MRCTDLRSDPSGPHCHAGGIAGCQSRDVREMPRSRTTADRPPRASRAHHGICRHPVRPASQQRCSPPFAIFGADTVDTEVLSIRRPGEGMIQVVAAMKMSLSATRALHSSGPRRSCDPWRRIDLCRRRFGAREVLSARGRSRELPGRAHRLVGLERCDCDPGARFDGPTIETGHSEDDIKIEIDDRTWTKSSAIPSEFGASSGGRSRPTRIAVYRKDRSKAR